MYLPPGHEGKILGYPQKSVSSAKEEIRSKGASILCYVPGKNML
jgi:hypothetical protein